MTVENQNKINLSLISLSNYRDDDIGNFFPNQKTDSQPILSYLESGYKWIYYDVDNLYPQRLQKLADYSTIHKNSLIMKRDLCVGDGLFSNNLELEEFISANDLTETFKRCANDYVKFGGFSLQVTWSLNGSKIARIKHQNFSQVRIAKPDKLEIDGFYLSADWSRQRQNNRYAPKYIPAFNPITKQDAIDNHSGNQLFYYTDYDDSSDFYPKPDYQSCLTDLMTARLLKEFWKSNLQNGFFPTVHMHLPGSFTSDDKIELINDIERNLVGAINKPRLFVTAGGNKEDAAIIETIQNNGNDNMFLSMESSTNQNIISAHRLFSPVLASFPGSGSLGGNGNEIYIAMETFYNVTVTGYQNALLSGFNKIINFAGYSDKIKVKEPNIFQYVNNMTTKEPTI